MDIRQLEYYSALVRKGSFTKAADELYVTRQTLSKAVRNLEHELGCKLVCNRDGHVRPTETGALLYAEAAPVIDSYRKLEERFLLRNDPRALQPTLSVALGHGVAFSLPGDYFEKFRAEFPHVRLSIEELPTDSVLELVAESEVDVGFVGSTPEYLQGFDRKLLVESGFYISIPPTNELAEKDYLTIQDLEGQPFVTYGKRNHLHRFFVEQCKKAGVHPDILLTSSDVYTLMHATQSSQALYFCFRNSPAPERVTKPLVLEPSPQFGTFAVKRKELPAASFAKLFWDWLK